MSPQKMFPAPSGDELFLTEGGIETELMYKWGFELPHFAAFPLLDNPDAVSVMRGMYRRSLDVAAAHGMSAMLTGLDYRASPDWGGLLGYSPEGLAEANHQAIDFLRDVARDYDDDIPRVLVGGIIGPRGDAYELNRTITADEAEDYHATQLTTLKQADVDFAAAMTFNNIPEAIGVARAASRIGVPLVISLTVDGTSRLKSGPTVAEAVQTIDAETDGAPACYMLNCSHPFEFEPGLTDGDWINRLRGFRPNASKMEKIALCQLGHLEEGDPVELGRLMGDLARRYPHMDIWGGCCGTGEVHLEEVARNVSQASRDRGTATG
jgi:homocysteine S-methyltransferase